MKRYAFGIIALGFVSVSAMPAFAENFGGVGPTTLTAGVDNAICHGWYRHGKAPSAEHLAELAHDPLVLAQVGPIDDLPLPVINVLNPCDRTQKINSDVRAVYTKGDTVVGATFSVNPNRADSTYAIYLIDTFDSIGGGDSIIIHELVHYYRGMRRSATLSGKPPTDYKWDGQYGTLVSVIYRQKYGYDPDEECSAFTAEYRYAQRLRQVNVAANAKPGFDKLCAQAKLLNK